MVLNLGPLCHKAAHYMTYRSTSLAQLLMADQISSIELRNLKGIRSIPPTLDILLKNNLKTYNLLFFIILSTLWLSVQGQE